jgi:secernin
VAIGNQSIFSNEPLEERPGLIGMDLVRLWLERGRTAREALEVIATLIETFGQGGAAREPNGAGYHNSFLLADPEEAWHLEASNGRWVARRMTLGAVSNHFAIRADWEIGSRDFESFARSQGLWREAARIDAAAAYRNPHVPGHISEGRQRRATELLEAGRGRHEVGSFQEILRDHGEGGAVWRYADGSPEQECYFTLCAHSEPVSWTTASLVAALPRERVGPWPVWISFATPCTGIFLPVYLHGVVPAVLTCGAGEEPEEDSAWWILKRLQDAASVDPPRFTPLLREGWRELEERMEAERGDVEGAARRAALGGDASRAARIVSDFMACSVEAALKRADELRAEIS